MVKKSGYFLSLSMDFENDGRKATVVILKPFPMYAKEKIRLSLVPLEI